MSENMKKQIMLSKYLEKVSLPIFTMIFIKNTAKNQPLQIIFLEIRRVLQHSERKKKLHSRKKESHT
jgi:hypothetical protein